ncbi:MAG: glycoside hydrolase family 27 protein [Terriglobales bacterium]
MRTCKPYLLIALALLFLAAAPAPRAAAPSQLAGTWRAQQTYTFRGHSHQVDLEYVLQIRDGNHITGVAATQQGHNGAIKGTLAGNRVRLEVYDPFRPRARGRTYRGTLQGAKLTLTFVPGKRRSPSYAGFRRFTPHPITFHKVSADTVYELPPELRHPPLQPFHPIPPNGLALTPPMGWNSWNHFNVHVNAEDIRKTADLLVSSGMAAAGYVYVNIDDTWEGSRDAQGNIQPNSKFPDMKALADYVHAKGLKLGIYSSPGPKTCAGYTGSYLHEAQDARTYAKWGIDYLKYDWCSASEVYTPDQMQAVYEKMARALRATGRPIAFSLCEYGWENVGQWGAQVGGNLWRTTGDIEDNYASMARNGFSQNGRQNAAGPGHWNDPDMLEIGNGGMSDTEYRTHMSLWSMLAAPLIAGNDLSKMTPDILAILTNREVIAIDQDKLGKQGYRVAKDGDLEIWKKPLAGGATAVALFNRGPQGASMTASWAKLGAGNNPEIRDLWAHRSFRSPGHYTVTVASHGVVMLRVH